MMNEGERRPLIHSIWKQAALKDWLEPGKASLKLLRHVGPACRSPSTGRLVMMIAA